MTYPPQQPGEAGTPGLGEPVTGMPAIQPPPTSWTAPGTPPPSGPPPQPPSPPSPPSFPEPEKPSRVPWAIAGVLTAVSVIGLVVALVVIKSSPEIDPDDVAGGSSAGIECEPSSEKPEKPLSAGEFYDDKTWTNSLDDSDTADSLGAWDHADCCDVGLATSQEELNSEGCVYGIESAYESADGHLGIAQLILAFEDDSGARQAAQIDFTSFKLHSDSGVYDAESEVYGYIESTGAYLVVTIGAIDTEDESIVDEKVQTLGGFHYDHLDVLPWQ